VCASYKPLEDELQEALRDYDRDPVNAIVRAICISNQRQQQQQQLQGRSDSLLSIFLAQLGNRVEALSKIDSKTSSLESKVDSVGSRLSSLESKVDSQGDSFGSKVDSLGIRLSSLESKVDSQGESLGSKIDSLGGRQSSLESKFDSLDSKVDGLANGQRTALYVILAVAGVYGGEKIWPLFVKLVP
jgi:outer membrane murein-binding lipoprotein Lpp